MSNRKDENLLVGHAGIPMAEIGETMLKKKLEFLNITVFNPYKNPLLRT